MIDMKLNQDQVQLPGQQQTENNGPAYPDGLTIRLNAESLKRLAMGLPQVGDVFTLSGLVEVVGVEKSNMLIEDEKRVELQITAIGLNEPDERNEQQKSYDQVQAVYK